MDDEMRDPDGSSDPGTRREPRYVAAARFLKPKTEDLETFLARHAGKVSSTTFPGPDCLHPDELWELRRGSRLPKERAEHLAICDACSAMEEATKPSKERLQAFRDAVAARDRVLGGHGIRLVPDADPTVSRDQTAVLAGVRSPRWVPALAAGLMLASAGIITLVRRPDGQTKDGTPNKIIPVNVIAPIALKPRVVVTAEVTSSKKQNQVFVRTPPITVTASATDAAATAAATAAVLTHFDVVKTSSKAADAAVQGAITSCSAIPDKCQELAKSFAGLFSDYLEAEKANGTTNVSVSSWFEEYKKTHPEEVLALVTVSKSGETDSATLTSTKPAVSPTQLAADAKIARIVPTLQSASVYYVQAQEKLKDPDSIVGDVDLHWRVKDRTLKVTVANSFVATDETKKPARSESKQ